MEKDMADAFSEVANIIYGAIGDLTVGKSPEHGKLRCEGIQLVDPSSVSDLRSLWPAGPAFGAEVAIDFPGFQPGTAFIVFEDAVLSRILGVPASSPAAEPSDPGKAVDVNSRCPMLFIAEFTEPSDPGVALVCEAAVEKGNAIPVLGVSHSPTRETILSARRAGVRAFLVHPISTDLFQSRMDTLLSASAKA